MSLVAPTVLVPQRYYLHLEEIEKRSKKYETMEDSRRSAKRVESAGKKRMRKRKKMTRKKMRKMRKMRMKKKEMQLPLS